MHLATVQKNLKSVEYQMEKKRMNPCNLFISYHLQKRERKNNNQYDILYVKLIQEILHKKEDLTKVARLKSKGEVKCF